MSNLKNEIGQSSKIRVCLVAPSLDILGGQSRQAALLLAGLRDEPTLEVGFIPHNPRLPGALRRLQTIKYVRTLVATLRYCGMLLVQIPRYDVIHVFSAALLTVARCAPNIPTALASAAVQVDGIIK